MASCELSVVGFSISLRLFGNQTSNQKLNHISQKSWEWQLAEKECDCEQLHTGHEFNSSHTLNGLWEWCVFIHCAVSGTYVEPPHLFYASSLLCHYDVTLPSCKLYASSFGQELLGETLHLGRRRVHRKATLKASPYIHRADLSCSEVIFMANINLNRAINRKGPMTVHPFLSHYDNSLISNLSSEVSRTSAKRQPLLKVHNTRKTK